MLIYVKKDDLNIYHFDTFGFNNKPENLDDYYTVEFSGQMSDFDGHFEVRDGICVYVPGNTRFIRRAEEEKAKRLKQVLEQTQLWHLQLMLEMISVEDKAKLVQWVEYAKALQTVDTSKATGTSDIHWPQRPE
ncbi:tail fiber assembly protein [Xenorhabdus sp. PB61.4]|uniref:tail fiber assembly protein n=1 Tax=Xenorhabdus sp. PB61.4 TaxID=2788940 RepID=UPI001E5245E3|nr:tail fiber assembly protein [Xenorhabdus sp. PB61.4]MCC8364986.1 tail fiber assembly protein [Xenorhabdus sp. PB61.4]